MHLLNTSSTPSGYKFSPRQPTPATPKTCVTCKHFIRDDPAIDARLGKCRLFGEMDMVSGVVRYNFAANCRQFDEECGVKAQYYEPADPFLN